MNRMFRVQKMQAEGKAGTSPPALTRTMESISMTQADSAHTTIPSRLSRASASASASASAVRERTARKLPVGIQICFANLIDNLRGIDLPHLIGSVADEVDLRERADHIEAVLKEITAYAKAVVGDTRYNANLNINDETGTLEDATGEIVGALRSAAERLREIEADAA